MNAEQYFEKYASVAVNVGLNVQPGQRLLITAPIETAELVRIVAAHAYQRGARLVSVLWRDQALDLVRYTHAPRDSFDEFPMWYAEARLDAARNGDASLSIAAENPDLLKGQDQELIARADKASAQALSPFLAEVTRNTMNWSVISVPVPAWSQRVFPGLTAEAADEKLWEAILSACRILENDPVAAWKSHIGELDKRRQYLTRKQYTSLHIKSPGTDLMLGLAPNHIWLGGDMASKQGIRFVPNMPTEEVFSLPDRNRVEGIVQCSRPLSHSGTLIQDFTITFENGRATQVTAGAGQDLLRHLVETDEGAGRLGEVALVPASAPTARLGLLFYNTLFDENAASHIALGAGYKFCLQSGETMAPAEFVAAGGNESLIHVDFMIGTQQTDIDGITESGERQAVMRDGEWAFAA
ncbi:MAG: aminopeptidase [Rudaea sp.]